MALLLILLWWQQCFRSTKTGNEPSCAYLHYYAGGRYYEYSALGGPTARVMSSLKLGHTEIFVPMIPVMVIGIIWVFIVAYILGIKEKRE